jgi:hypothetical protein
LAKEAVAGEEAVAAEEAVAVAEGGAAEAEAAGGAAAGGAEGAVAEAGDVAGADVAGGAAASYRGAEAMFGREEDLVSVKRTGCLPGQPTALPDRWSVARRRRPSGHQGAPTVDVLRASTPNC